MNKDEKAKDVAKIVCNKNVDCTFEECKKNSNCSKCRIQEKSEEQLNYILSSINENIFLDACPGSGKTEVVSLKAKYEINQWNQCGGIAFLTFTNEAAKVIEDRVKEINGNNIFPHFIGTLHSFIHGYISQPYGYKFIEYINENDQSIRVIDEKDRSVWLNSFKVNSSRILKIPIYANQISINPINNDVFIEENNKKYKLTDYYNRPTIQEKIKLERKNKGWNDYFKEDYFKEQCIETKMNFLKHGFATFDDMLYIAYQVLIKDNNIAKNIANRFKLIFIDECQDLSDIELALIDILKENGTKIHLIGDLNQAIYEYKDAIPEIIKNYLNNKDFKTMCLKECYRCTQSIVNVFQRIVGKNNIIGKYNSTLKNNCILVDYTNITDWQLIEWYNTYCNIKLGKDSKRAILVRGNSLKNKLLVSNENNDNEIINIISNWNSNSFISKEKAMKAFGEKLCSYIKEPYKSNQFGCPNTIDSVVVWKNFLYSILKRTEDLTPIGMTYSIWYDNARKLLKPIIVENYKNYLLEYDTINHLSIIEKITFKTPRNMGSEIFCKDLIKECRFKNIKTIHSVKGQTFDSIMLVSNEKKGAGTNWEEWLTDTNSEYARMCYVASSRPRELLIWAVKNINEEQYNILENLGLKKEEIDLDLLN